MSWFLASYWGAVFEFEWQQSQTCTSRAKQAGIYLEIDGRVYEDGFRQVWLLAAPEPWLRYPSVTSIVLRGVGWPSPVVNGLIAQTAGQKGAAGEVVCSKFVPQFEVAVPLAFEHLKLIGWRL